MIKKILLFTLITFFLSQFELVYAQTNNQPTLGSSNLNSKTACTKVGNPTESEPAACSAPGSGPQAFPAFSGEVNVVYYCQGNTQWQNTCSLGLAGCGPTSMAMVMSSFGATITPPDLDRQWGFRSCGDSGSSMEAALTSSWLTSVGFESGPGLLSGGHLDVQLAKKYLDDKWLIIASSHAFPCANCRTPGITVDHIFVVDAVDVNNNTADIRDPNNCSYADGNDENQANRIKPINSFPWAYAYPVRRKP